MKFLKSSTCWNEFSAIWYTTENRARTLRNNSRPDQLIEKANFKLIVNKSSVHISWTVWVNVATMDVNVVDFSLCVVCMKCGNVALRNEDKMCMSNDIFHKNLIAINKAFGSPCEYCNMRLHLNTKSKAARVWMKARFCYCILFFRRVTQNSWIAVSKHMLQIIIELSFVYFSFFRREPPLRILLERSLLQSKLNWR